MINERKEVTESAKQVGERLKVIRKHFQLSQAEMCEKVGLSQGIWSRYELGVANVSKRVRLVLESTLNVNPKYLTLESDTMFKQANSETRQELAYKAMSLYYQLPQNKRAIVDKYIDATLDIIANLIDNS